MGYYIYQADVWCEDCGRDICDRITAECHAPECPDDEHTYDSDEYPKYSCDDGEADSPQHCGAGCDCLNAIELSGGHKIGAWLENDLTADGAQYVREAMESGGEVAELWAEWYGFSYESAESYNSPYFDRFDICEAYLAIENDYNVSGILQERPSNQRRNMSTDYQLHRMKFRPGASWNGYASLSENGRAIYWELLERYGLPSPKFVSAD